MNRREFLKISCSGLIALYLSGCGLNMQSGQYNIRRRNGFR